MSFTHLPPVSLLQHCFYIKIISHCVHLFCPIKTCSLEYVTADHILLIMAAQ